MLPSNHFFCSFLRIMNMDMPSRPTIRSNGLIVGTEKRAAQKSFGSRSSPVDGQSAGGQTSIISAANGSYSTFIEIESPEPGPSPEGPELSPHQLLVAVTISSPLFMLTSPSSLS